MHEYEINGVTLEINMNDADFVEKYTVAFENMKNESNDIQKVGKQSDMIRSYCNAFYHLFDNIFGIGTGQKLFRGKHDCELCEETYEQFLNICREQVEVSKKRKARIIGGIFKPPVS